MVMASDNKDYNVEGVISLMNQGYQSVTLAMDAILFGNAISDIVKEIKG